MFVITGFDKPIADYVVALEVSGEAVEAEFERRLRQIVSPRDGTAAETSGGRVRRPGAGRAARDRAWAGHGGRRGRLRRRAGSRTG